MYQKKCKWCKKDFQHASPNGETCSPACHKLYTARRKKLAAQKLKVKREKALLRLGFQP
jgi:hypothetical protein